MSSVVNDWSISLVCELTREVGRNQDKIDLDALETVKVDYLIRPLTDLPLVEVAREEIGVRVKELERIPRKFGDLKVLFQLLYLFRHIKKNSPFTMSTSINSNLLF